MKKIEMLIHFYLNTSNMNNKVSINIISNYDNGFGLGFLCLNSTTNAR